MDASQTLYEFRSSNPRALNVMEASGVFRAFKMQTNYRSNQEILDVANTTLSTIEANQFAKLQLRANSLAPVTSKSLQEKVNIEFHNCANLREFDDVILPQVVTDSIVPYIQDKIAKGEQVAFLAYKNSDIRNMQEMLSNYFDPEKIVNIAPIKIFDSTIFSAYIRYFGENIGNMQLAANSKTGEITPITDQIRTHMLEDHTLTVIARNASKQLDNIARLADEWHASNKDLLIDEQQRYTKGLISKQDLIELIMQNMLDFEIKHNRIRQNLLAQKNNDRKNDQDMQNAHVILSTIHSAKGLEFDNVIILYQTDSSMNEEKKRMYYVALTRAMQSELIISYGTVRKCPLRSKYIELVNDHLTAEGLPLIEDK